jgi:hypothetical protein
MSRATIRNVLDVFVGLGGLKMRKKSFDMHHGETKIRRPWCSSNHGATSTSSVMATFLVVYPTEPLGGASVEQWRHNMTVTHMSNRKAISSLASTPSCLGALDRAQHKCLQQQACHDPCNLRKIKREACLWVIVGPN